MGYVTLVVLAVGSFLSFWGVSLVVRALAERIEIRAQRRRQHEKSLSRAKPPASRTASADSSSFAAPGLTPAVVNPVRNVLVLTLWPLAFVGGLAICWVPLDMLRPGSGSGWPDHVGMTALIAAIAQVQIAAGCAWVGWCFGPSRGRRRCPSCWYDMGGHSSRFCPECGKEARSERSMYRTQRKFGLIWLAAALLVGVYFTFKAHEVRRTGLLALVPTTLLIAGLEYMPSSMIIDPPGHSEPANLRHRVDERQLFAWQSAWLDSRATGMYTRSDDPRLAYRVLGFAQSARWNNVLPTEPALEQLGRMLGSSDPADRSVALAVLSGNYTFWNCLRSSSESCVRVARRCAADAAAGVVDPNPGVALLAALLVSFDAAHADRYVPRLVQQFSSDTSPNKALARTSATVLAWLSRTSPVALEAWTHLIESADPATREIAADSLREACEARPEAVDRAVNLLADPSDQVASKAAWALGTADTVRPAADELLARAVLAQATSRATAQDELLKAAVAIAVGNWRSTKLPAWIIEELGAIFEDPGRSPALRETAIAALRERPTGTAVLLPRLRPGSKDPALSRLAREDAQRLVDQLEREAREGREAAPQTGK